MYPHKQKEQKTGKEGKSANTANIRINIYIYPYYDWVLALYYVLAISRQHIASVGGTTALTTVAGHGLAHR
jgi:hypothetical protein